MSRSRPILAAALVLSSLGLLACGSDAEGSASDAGAHGDDHGESTPVADGARRVEVTAADFAFDPDEIAVEVGEDVAIVLTSEDLLHDFTVDELDAHVVAEVGETAEGGLRVDEAGTYDFYCSVPGHREAGMEGTIVAS